MAKPKKVHRAGSDGRPMCGKMRKDGPVITRDNEKVTCGLCHHSMHGSWGVPLPAGPPPRRGGRKPGYRSKKSKEKANRELQARLSERATEHRAEASQLVRDGLLEEAAERQTKAGRLERVIEDLKEDV